MRILQAETTEGTLTPTIIADSILNITGAQAAPPTSWPPLQLLPPLLNIPYFLYLSQVTSSTWPAWTCRAHSPWSWGQNRPP